jgi:hypothetical protein
MNCCYCLYSILRRIGNEEFQLLGYNPVQSVESQRTFRSNMSPPSSGMKSKPTLQPGIWGGRLVPAKRLFTFNGLHRIISQKIEIFTTTATRTSFYSYTLLSAAFIEVLKRVSKEMTQFCNMCYFKDPSKLTPELLSHLHIQLPLRFVLTYCTITCSVLQEFTF